MVNGNETVADIVGEMRSQFPPKYCSSKSCRVEIDQPVRTFASRIEAAHKREVAEKNGERKGILKANKALAADNTRLRGEVVELRECLREAVYNECNYCRTVRKDGTYGRCEHLRDDGGCDHLRGVKCIVHKWRNTLEGVNDAH